MRILFDAREGVRNKTGIGNVVRHFLKYIETKHDSKYEFIIVPMDYKSERKKGLKIFNLINHLIWKQVFIPLKALLTRSDVILSLAPEANFFTTKPIVIMVYDMIFFKLPPEATGVWGRYWRFIVPSSIRKAAKVIAISEFTKRDVVEIAKVDPAKIDVLYLGFDEFKKGTSVNTIIPDDYFLFVGAPEARRGIECLVDSFKAFLKYHPHFKLVIVGQKNDYFKQLKKKIIEDGIEDKILCPGYVSSEDLATYYSKAFAFIYPSWYEGFGLTLLEAMFHGCPVITTNVSSLPEVAGDAAILVSPNNTEELLNAMLRVVGDEKLRKDLIERGYRNLERFSWDKFDFGVLKILEEVGREKTR